MIKSLTEKWRGVRVQQNWCVIMIIFVWKSFLECLKLLTSSLIFYFRALNLVVSVHPSLTCFFPCSFPCLMWWSRFASFCSRCFVRCLGRGCTWDFTLPTLLSPLPSYLSFLPLLVMQFILCFSLDERLVQVLCSFCFFQNFFSLMIGLPCFAFLRKPAVVRSHRHRHLFVAPPFSGQQPSASRVSRFGPLLELLQQVRVFFFVFLPALCLHKKKTS